MAIVRWLPQNVSSVDVEWEEPEMPNGEITHFIIKLLNYTSGELLQSVTFGVDGNTIVYRVSFGAYTTLGESSASELQLPDLPV